MRALELQRAFAAATRCVERYRETINSLNVFPVPDGDTGTNMLLTMRSAMDKCQAAPLDTAGSVAREMAEGAFWGARGNSGIILSQFFKGFAEGLRGKETCGSADLARAFSLGTQAAYKAVSQPVEGTMLTVIRSISDAVQEKLAQGEDDALPVWETAFQASAEALQRTPSQLPVLREAGVVDAGGLGIVAIVGGMLSSLLGQDGRQADLGLERYIGTSAEAVGPLSKGDAKGELALPSHPSSDYLDATEEVQWGYCTQFLIAGEELDLEAIRQRFTAMADSTAVVGDERHIRVHIHAPDPGPAISYGVSLGQLAEVKIENMDHQNQQFVADHRAGSFSLRGVMVESGHPPQHRTDERIAVVAVTPGEGLAQLFQEIGTAVVVVGGQTRNPSIQELLNAAKSARAHDVIILPNNQNIVAAAAQAAAVANGQIHVVPSRTVPQGVAAILAFNPEETLEHNLEAMRQALTGVSTIEVTQAVRDTILGAVRVTAGQYIGLLEGRLVAAEPTPEMALQSVLAVVGLSSDQVVTLYWGADTPQERAEAVRRQAESQAPGIQVDLIYGGQPYYHYLASVE